MARLGSRPRLLLQRRLPADPGGQASPRHRDAHARGVEGGLRRCRGSHCLGDARRRRDLGQGPDADPGAQRVPGGDLSHLLLQPAVGRGCRRRPDVRGQRGDRTRHQRTAAGDAARAGRVPASGQEPRRGGRRRLHGPAHQHPRLSLLRRAPVRRFGEPGLRRAARTAAPRTGGLALRADHQGRGQRARPPGRAGARSADRRLGSAPPRGPDRALGQDRAGGAGRGPGAWGQSASLPRFRHHRVRPAGGGPGGGGARHRRRLRQRSGRDRSAAPAVSAVAELHGGAARAPASVRAGQPRLSAADRAPRRHRQGGARRPAGGRRPGILRIARPGLFDGRALRRPVRAGLAATDAGRAPRAGLPRFRLPADPQRRGRGDGGLRRGDRRHRRP